jgi:glyoxylase-like metal-dependent hydrolase (beta-lactamase superfamily II)
MIQLHKFVFSPFQENTYLLADENKNAIIIDPGMYDRQEQEVMKKFIADKNLNLKKVLLTHAHLDHIFGLKFLVEHYDVPFFIHESELPVYNTAKQVAESYGVELQMPQKDYTLISENDKVHFGSEELEIRFAPGHSPGSICYYNKQSNWVISGDVLFQNSIGRTDLPGGDTATLLKSVQTQLFTMPVETVVHSGHGPETTVGLEKMNNPFFNRN